MAHEIRCRCPRCTIRGLMGPAAVITVGVLFLLHQMFNGLLNIANTYPVILVVMGLILVIASFASTDGHISGANSGGSNPPSAAAQNSTPPGGQPLP